ncbi:CrcB family protein [bacterium TMED221]|nr:MAG: CrcB family protein [bacterium TMED221]
MNTLDKKMYSKVLLVFVGGGIGTVLRFLLNTLINVSSLPQFSTLFINVLGSFLFGIIYSIVAENSLVSIFLLTGILGGFTTYSQFTFDLIQLNTQSQLSTVSYFFATVLLSIFGALIGVYIGSKLVN